MGHCWARGPDRHLGTGGVSQRDKGAPAGEKGRELREKVGCTDTQRQGSEGPQGPCAVSGAAAPSHEPSFWPGWHLSPGMKEGGCGRQGGHQPGGLRTQRGPWGASSQAAQRGACRSCRRAARLTACGNGRFLGARNPGGSLRRQSGCGFAGRRAPGRHRWQKPTLCGLALGCGGGWEAPRLLCFVMV